MNMFLLPLGLYSNGFIVYSIIIIVSFSLTVVSFFLTWYYEDCSKTMFQS